MPFAALLPPPPLDGEGDGNSDGGGGEVYGEADDADEKGYGEGYGVSGAEDDVDDDDVWYYGADGNRRIDLNLDRSVDRNLQRGQWNPDTPYTPLRIHVDTSYLDDLPTYYLDRAHFLKSEVLPEVVRIWRNALRVFAVPPSSPITVNDQHCPYANDDNVKAKGGVGVQNADLVVYVAANVASICNEGPLAAAISCQADQYDRPTVGAAVVCLDTIDLSSPKSRSKTVQVMVHEFAHILGVRSIDFAYFYDPATGLPRTSRPLAHRKQLVTCVDGAKHMIVVPDANTMVAGTSRRGNRHFEIVTPAVTTVVQNHFNCPGITGARLENTPTNHGNCFGTHWEDRLFHSDYLTAIRGPTRQHLTPLTLALLEDSGWYRPDYSASSVPPFGHGAGCDFVYGDCVVDGKVPTYASSYFCDEPLTPEAPLRCDSGHDFIARCDLVNYDDYPYSKPPGPTYRYFPSNPLLGGLLHTADYCPMHSMVTTGTNAKGKFEFDCSDKELSSSVQGETFGATSKCFNTNLSRPVCLKMRCNAIKYAVEVVFGEEESSNERVLTCPFDGAEMDLGAPKANKVATFECPKLSSVCPE